MSRLQVQQHRLFGLPESAVPTTGNALPVGRGGVARVLVLGLHGPADWATLSPLWRGVQAELRWPEPAIAVNGTDAFELWFSLTEPLPRAEAAALLVQLQRRYLSGVRADRLRTWPLANDTESEPPACPPYSAGPERWASFVTPDLPAVFGDDPALDFAPGADAQAELLARLRTVSAVELRHALTVLSETRQPVVAKPETAALVSTRQPIFTPTLPISPPKTPPIKPTDTQSPASTGQPAIAPSQDPRAFLTAVMNDATAPLALRIEAAKGLLQAKER